MRFLNIIRHAKAENDYTKNDFERELAERGQEDSKFLDSFLFRYSFKKHKILCSTSIRTLQTYQNLKFSLNEKSRIIFTDDLYLANARTIYELIIKESKSYMITIIGHNPGLSDILSFFTGKYDIPDLKTSSVAQIIFNDTKKINEGDGTLKFLIQSKNNEIISLS
tara:strand:- start:903 stop:1400 length:498 start_codon:yes stop_codon:yes gene_type:complete